MCVTSRTQLDNTPRPTLIESTAGKPAASRRHVVAGARGSRFTHGLLRRPSARSVRELSREPAGESEAIESGMVQAREQLGDETSEASWMRWNNNSRFRKGAAVGDTVIRIWTHAGTVRDVAGLGLRSDAERGHGRRDAAGPWPDVRGIGQLDLAGLEHGRGIDRACRGDGRLRLTDRGWSPGAPYLDKSPGHRLARQRALTPHIQSRGRGGPEPPACDVTRSAAPGCPGRGYCVMIGRYAASFGSRSRRARATSRWPGLWRATAG